MRRHSHSDNTTARISHKTALRRANAHPYFDRAINEQFFDDSPPAMLPIAGVIDSRSQQDSQTFLVSFAGGSSDYARVAASCLLEPEPGDQVACMRVEKHSQAQQTQQIQQSQQPTQPSKDLSMWIVAVLDRSGQAPRRLRMHGDTRLEVQSGALQLTASKIELEGQRVAVKAQETQVTTESAEVVGRHLRVTGSVLKLVGSVLTTVMERVSHYSGRYVRTTQGTDRVSATHVECEAQQLLRLSGEHALINGEKLVKARGGQIHFG